CVGLFRNTYNSMYMHDSYLQPVCLTDHRIVASGCLPATLFISDRISGRSLVSNSCIISTVPLCRVYPRYRKTEIIQTPITIRVEMRYFLKSARLEFTFICKAPVNNYLSERQKLSISL